MLLQKYNKRNNEEIIEEQNVFESFAKTVDGTLDFYWIFVAVYFG